MAKVVRFHSDNMDMETQARELLEMIKRGEIKQLAIIANTNDGCVMTSYHGCDVGDKQYLCSHMQVDINYEIVRVNMDHLVEYVDE